MILKWSIWPIKISWDMQRHDVTLGINSFLLLICPLRFCVLKSTISVCISTHGRFKGIYLCFVIYWKKHFFGPMDFVLFCCDTSIGHGGISERRHIATLVQSSSNTTMIAPLTAWLMHDGMSICLASYLSVNNNLWLTVEAETWFDLLHSACDASDRRTSCLDANAHILHFSFWCLR